MNTDPYYSVKNNQTGYSPIYLQVSLWRPFFSIDSIIGINASFNVAGF